MAAASEEAKRTLRYVEPLREVRTPLGEKRVSARGGWAGEKSDFFSILLVLTAPATGSALRGLAGVHDRLGVGL